MLKKVLQEMSTSDVYSRAVLARRLGISEGLLSQMMELLVRKGYIAALETPSGCEGCGGCGRGKACSGCGFSEANDLKGWALTAKGREAADGRPDREAPR